MMKQETTIKKHLDRIQVILNDDVGCVDFLADLWDRGLIHDLERFVRYGNRQNACLLRNCRMDGLFVLVLYKAPFEFIQPENKLMVFAYHDLRKMCGYFQRWMDATEETQQDEYKALRDIIALLYYNWAELQDENAQVDNQG